MAKSLAQAIRDEWGAWAPRKDASPKCSCARATRGGRYSRRYPASPDLEDNLKVAELSTPTASAWP